MRHGVLPNVCCCEERCYPCSGIASSETTAGCDAGVGRCPRGKHRELKEAGERVSARSHGCVLATAPSLRRAALVGDVLEHLCQVGGFVLDGHHIELLRRIGHADDELRRELRLDLGTL